MLRAGAAIGSRLRIVKAMPACRSLYAGSAFEPTETHGKLREMMRKFAEQEVDPQANDFNRDERFNIPLFRKLGDLGVLGITVPEEYGGAGMDATSACIVHEELAAADPAFCLSYLAHSLLFVNNLARNGSHEQKREYLPRACSGELIGGMCMSEPDAGTDVLAMRTKAVRCSDGGFSITGNKMWITNGTLDGNTTGDAFLVYAKTGDPASRDGLSLFLVEKGSQDFRLGQQIKDKCGMRASMTAELVFDSCLVPASSVVGEIGGATKCMMRNLEVERLCLAAMSCGIARRCVEVMAQYSTERSSFGKPLKSFGQIQRLVGESFAQMRAGRAYLYETAAKTDLDSVRNPLKSAPKPSHSHSIDHCDDWRVAFPWSPLGPLPQARGKYYNPALSGAPPPHPEPWLRVFFQDPECRRRREARHRRGQALLRRYGQALRRQRHAGYGRKRIRWGVPGRETVARESRSRNSNQPCNQGHTLEPNHKP